jgi:DNA-binding IclR family transcriptional regulator
MKNQDNYYTRLFRILECIAASKGRAGFAQIREITQMPPATLSRILSEAKTSGILAAHTHGVYTFGPLFTGLVQKSIPFIRQSRIQAQLQRLHQETGLRVEYFTYQPVLTFVDFKEKPPDPETGVVFHMQQGYQIRHLHKMASGLCMFFHFPKRKREYFTKLNKRQISQVDKTMKAAKKDGYICLPPSSHPAYIRMCLFPGSKFGAFSIVGEKRLFNKKNIASWVNLLRDVTGISDIFRR